MENIMKYIMACLFSLAFLITANAQDENITSPGPEDIICVQVAENVFDCYLKEDFDQGADTSKGHRLNEEYKLNEEDKDLFEGKEENMDDPSVKKNNEEENIENMEEDNSGVPIDGKLEEEIPEIKVQCFNP